MTKEKAQFSIVGKKRTKAYSSQNYPVAAIEVEVIDFVRCPNSWDYKESYETDSIVQGETRIMPERFYGKDMLQCRVRIIPLGKPIEQKYVSMVRSVSDPDPYCDADATYRTSAMVRDKVSVSLHGDEVRRRPYQDDNKMMWELSGPDPITNDDQVEFLIEESERLFEDRLPMRI